MLLLGISIGTINDHVLVPEPHVRCCRAQHRYLLTLLPLFQKYDCPGLETDALELIIPIAKTMIEIHWYADKFLEEPYDPIAEIYGGVYPKKLYPAFAWAWKDERSCNTSVGKADRDYDITTARMATIIESTPTLALFLTNSYCDALTKTENLLFEARKLAEKQIVSLKEAQTRSKGMVEALKHIRQNPDY